MPQFFAFCISIFLLFFASPPCVYGADGKESVHGGPSFDCNKAKSKFERLICSSEASRFSLRPMDLSLAVIYKAALARTNDPGLLRAAQRAWLKNTEKECDVPQNPDGFKNRAAEQAAACFLTHYEERIAELRDELGADDPFNEPGLIRQGAFNYDNGDRNELFRGAVNWGDLKRLRELLKHPEGLDLHRGLSIAAIHGSLGEAKLLVAAGASPNGLVVNSDTFNWTPLNSAAKSDKRTITDYFLSIGGDVFVPQSNDVPLLTFAVMTGRVDFVKKALQMKPDLEDQLYAFRLGDKKGVSALMVAVERGFSEIADLLLEAGANPNTKKFDGETALHKAVRLSGDAALVRKLINAGADVNANGESGYPISGCVDLEIVKILLEAGADVNAQDSMKRTVLHWAALACKPELMNYLLEQGADPNARNFWEQTPKDGWFSIDGIKMHCSPSNWPKVMMRSSELH